jgi:hypothetical protein
VRLRDSCRGCDSDLDGFGFICRIEYLTHRLMSRTFLQLPKMTPKPTILTVTNHNARRLGRLAKGKPKKYSPEELKKRTERLLAARHKRKHWPKRKKKH